MPSARRILEAAEGNPLFVEEMVALVRESPDGDIAVPPTIQALLAARLDQLDPAERVVLERGSVEGRMFHRGAVQALSPDEAQLVDAAHRARAAGSCCAPTGRSSRARTPFASATC